MTVIEMAREAGMTGLEDGGLLENFLAFAELVRADERRAMMQLFTDPENQPTQHGTVTVEYMQREIADEREACAKVCENEWSTLAESKYGEECADAIRARSNT
jgi:hypothetical protein